MTSGKKRVLFVCIGNSCRSQMAEGFASRYGGDVLVAASAGVAPAMSVASYTIRSMDEKNIDLRDHFPKSLKHLNRISFDLVVNMSGVKLPDVGAPVRDWTIEDPMGSEYEVYCEVRDLIERQVMDLILELRKPKP